VIFESFKHTEEDKRDFVSQIGVVELENSVADNNQDSKKRKILFKGLPPCPDKFDLSGVLKS